MPYKETRSDATEEADSGRARARERARTLAKRRTPTGVFPSAVDTDMIRAFEMPKTPAIDAARATLDGIESGEQDIFPDPMARQVYSAWRQDHKAVERQFAAM